MLIPSEVFDSPAFRTYVFEATKVFTIKAYQLKLNR